MMELAVACGSGAGQKKGGSTHTQTKKNKKRVKKNRSPINVSSFKNIDLPAE